MSDQNGDDRKPDQPEAELLGPERNAREPRPRKDPPVIEGEAEEVVGASSAGAQAAGGGSASASAKPEPAEDKSPEKQAAVPSPRLYAAIIAAAVVAAVVVVVLLRVAGFGRTDAKVTQAIADLDAKVAAADDRSAQNADALQAASQRLDAAEAKIAAEAQTPESTTAINARLDKIAAQTEALQKSLGDTVAAAAASGQKLDELAKAMPPAGIADQVAKLDAMLKAMNAALDALTPKIDQMQARVAALEAKKDDPDAAARAALGLALANLARAAEGPGPFESELDAVAAFLPKEAELQALAPAAQTGVPTEASLKERFPTLVQSVLDAEHHAKGDGLFARFVANIEKLVTVRRVGEISGDDTDAVLARMEERLKVDDLGAAVAEGKALKGAAAEAAASWLKDAGGRVATEKLLGDLTAHVAARLAPPSAPATGAKG